jgi:transposase
MEVDWAGDTAFILHNITGEKIPVYIFVSVLPYSGYAYTEGFLSQNLESWITAHVNAYQFMAERPESLRQTTSRPAYKKRTGIRPL